MYSRKQDCCEHSLLCAKDHRNNSTAARSILTSRSNSLLLCVVNLKATALSPSSSRDILTAVVFETQAFQPTKHLTHQVILRAPPAALSSKPTSTSSFEDDLESSASAPLGRDRTSTSIIGYLLSVYHPRTIGSTLAQAFRYNLCLQQRADFQHQHCSQITRTVHIRSKANQCLAVCLAQHEGPSHIYPILLQIGYCTLQADLHFTAKQKLSTRTCSDSNDNWRVACRITA